MPLNTGKFCRKLTVLLSIGGLCAVLSAAHAGFWTTGYYPGYEQAGMPATNIDFTALTHVIHFSVVPNANGTLDSGANTISAANSAAVVSAAHAAGRKALIYVGGGGSESLFQAAASAASLPVFIDNITNFVGTRGYDGVDLDWEPLPSTDARQYTNLVNGLRSALHGFSQPKLLTAAVGAYPPYGDSPTADYLMFASLQTQFDQININLTFSSIALGSYRVQYKSNLTVGAWNTLLVTNVAGPGGPLQINDAGAATNQPGRFYRIQTPP